MSDTAFRASMSGPFAEPVAWGSSPTTEPGIVGIGGIVDGLAADAAAVGYAVRTLPVEEFVAGQPFHDRLLWVNARDPVAMAMLPGICRRGSEEAIPMVVEVGFDQIDDVAAEVDFDDDVALLVEPKPGERSRAIARCMGRQHAVVHDSFADARTDEIVNLQNEVARISRMLARLSRDETEARPVPPSPFIDEPIQSPRRDFGAQEGTRAVPVSVRDVRMVIRQRRLRDELFDPELFADPAWDMLLDLFAARLDRHRVSVSSLCIAAAVPATTALRWIKSLTDQGLFERQEDPHDGRRIFVALSDRAALAMQAYFNRLADARHSV